MNRSTKIWLVLAGIVLFASFLRLYHITTTPAGLYPDEAMNGNNALEVVQTGHFKVFYPEDNGREGLYVDTLAFFIKVFGNQPWVVRLPAAVTGILTVAVIYFLGAELLGEEAGLLAAFLLAACFWHIDLSRIGFRAIMAPFFLISALYFALKSFRSEKEPRAWIYAILGGVFFGAGFYTYIAYRIMPLLFLVFIPFFRKHAHFWRRAAVFTIVTIMIALPIGIYFLQHAGSFFGRTSEISVTSTGNPIGAFSLNAMKTLGMFNFRGDGNWRQNIAGAPELFFPVGILFLFGIALAAISLFRSARRRSPDNPEPWYPAFSLTLIVAWFAIGLVPAAASNEGIPHALRSILMLPPAIFFAAIGGIWAYRALRNGGFKKTSVALGILFVVIVGVNGYTSYFVTWAKNPNVPGAFNENYVQIGEAINALPASTPKYVIVNAGGVLARGIPVPAETVIFITDSFMTSTRLAKNITYLLPDQTDLIPPGTPTNTIFSVN